MSEQHLPDGTRSLDQQRPHSARVWDYWLGGKNNYEVDREVGDQMAEVVTDVVEAARADRGFLMRSVRHFAADAGIRQFLDLGAGLPTNHNTHEVAQGVAPESRVVYVDNDPLVLRYAEALLTSGPEGATNYVDADVRDVTAILEQAAKTLDFSRPVAVMMLGIVQFIVDDAEAREVVRRFVAAVPSGSYLALAHPVRGVSSEVDGVLQMWNEASVDPQTLRTHADVAGYFDGLELLEPGVVPCAQWRPEDAAVGQNRPVAPWRVCAVGRKP
ncbi:translation initiation factor IF-2 [Streptomyces sp. WAC 06738]|uniref:SAM-dependent methyltransferase n=1 Tax=Streptomyces sp. WAC 06738 TaxID=2203210 RepID=UPI000F6B6DBA|nr:SAM-dependent methyltransferase [Streptomyces sp. WAC 06738]AZM45187.1 translation initiation factor IF-2 [Streptomyces sp. WAC 06738]